MTTLNFRHIEFLIDIAESTSDLNKMSATKIKRFNELKEVDMVCLHEDKPYPKLTTKGEEALSWLEHQLNKLVRLQP